MALTIENKSHTINFTLDNGDEYELDKELIHVKISWGKVIAYAGAEQSNPSQKIKFNYKEVTSPVFTSNADAANTIIGWKVATGIIIGAVTVIDGENQLAIDENGSIGTRITDSTGAEMILEPNGSIPVTLQDQHTPTVITHMSVLEETTTTTSLVAVNDTTVDVASVTGISAGKYLAFFDPTSVRFMNAFVISVDTLTVTIDRPFDFEYPSGSYVDVSEHDLTKVGVGTLAAPIIAGVRNNAGVEPPPGLELSMDVTRVMFHCIADSACNLTTFGDIEGGLTNGIVLRKRDGSIFNIFNSKSNADLKEIMFDFDIMNTGTVGHGEDGFFGRLTFAGQSKMGVTIRLAINEDLELFIQDDITSLLHFSIKVEGSIVQG